MMKPDQCLKINCSFINHIWNVKTERSVALDSV